MSNTTTTVDFMQVVNDRHAVKKYDSSVKISKAELTELIETATKAPSAWNLQHWKFVVIDDQAQKEKLLPIAYGQQQVVEASAVIAVLGDLEANKNAETIFGGAVQAGQLPQEVKDMIVGQIEGAYKSPQVARDSAVLNGSLAAMQLMLAAKAKGYDTCAMGGYDAVKFAEAFKVPSRYIPLMLISVGKAATPARASFRFPAADTIIWNQF
ncbi:nitroreductase family protein [Paenibacillus selenitireducens]|uniref:Nitroreductase family protein n=1 Tax=Paenibacillus selenitireducens TaxID=1324314 RepID=A0A1T2X8G1_9BACL|nr:nitroreductase family protein [Paenibacillus selenitireducens]OPA76167.1 nitroreductase family protein [Paenibacillus selenitireducens]